MHALQYTYILYYIHVGYTISQAKSLSNCSASLLPEVFLSHTHILTHDAYIDSLTLVKLKCLQQNGLVFKLVVCRHSFHDHHKIIYVVKLQKLGKIKSYSQVLAPKAKLDISNKNRFRL